MRLLELPRGEERKRGRPKDEDAGAFALRLKEILGRGSVIILLSQLEESILLRQAKV